MEIRDALFEAGEKVIAKQIRYGPDDPHVEFDGVITGVRYVAYEDGERCETWEYQVRFDSPFVDESWYLEASLVEGVQYQHSSNATLSRPINR